MKEQYLDKQNIPSLVKYDKLHEVKIENFNKEKCDYSINSVSKIDNPHKEMANVLIEEKGKKKKICYGNRFRNFLFNNVL